MDDFLIAILAVVHDFVDIVEVVAFSLTSTRSWGEKPAAKLEDANLRLRGRRLEEVALPVGSGGARQMSSRRGKPPQRADLSPTARSNQHLRSSDHVGKGCDANLAAPYRHHGGPSRKRSVVAHRHRIGDDVNDAVGRLVGLHVTGYRARQQRSLR